MDDNINDIEFTRMSGSSESLRNTDGYVNNGADGNIDGITSGADNSADSNISGGAMGDVNNDINYGYEETREPGANNDENNANNTGNTYFNGFKTANNDRAWNTSLNNGNAWNYSNSGAVGINYGGGKPYKKKSRGFKIAVIAGVVILFLIVTAVFAAVCMGAISSSQSNEPDYGYGEDYIGILHIVGTMTSTSDQSSSYQQSWLIDQIDYMMDDPANMGIMLYVNSPGGEVYAADELYLKLEEYKETTERPLYAYFAETAASGGYYAAAGADKIGANRNCTTGSIGVYMGPVIDASALLEKAGIAGEYIKSSDNKAMGNYFEPFTDEQRAIYQSVVDEAYEQFVGIVAEGRGMSVEETRVVADGRVYTALQAMNAGLVDQVCQLEEFKDAMLEDNMLSCQWITVKYQPDNSLYSIFYSMEETIEKAASDINKSDVQAALELLEESEGYTLYALMR